MEVKFLKTHPDAKLPEQNNQPTDGTADSGYDLFAVERRIIPPVNKQSFIMQTLGEDSHLVEKYEIGSVVVPVGLEVAYIEPGYWFKIEARSGMGFKFGVQPHFGIIDNQYRGDLGIKLYNLGKDEYEVSPGDKIAQIIFYPLIEAQMSFAESKHETVRGEKGFGSSGK